MQKINGLANQDLKESQHTIVKLYFSTTKVKKAFSLFLENNKLSGLGGT